MPDPTLFPVDRRREKLEAILEVFDPARLTQARQAKGWTKKRLADALGVSAAAIGQYESGLIKPRVDQLIRLAEFLDVPPGFFTAGRPNPNVDASHAHFRSLRSMRAYERDQALVYVEQTWELAQVLERFVRLPPLDLPAPAEQDTGPVPPSAQSRAQVAAREIRDRWGLGDDPVAHLVRLLESRGVIVGVLPFSDSRRVNAFSTSHTTRPVIVLTDDRDDAYAHRFSAAHELGHLLLHYDALPGDPRHEREANAFAAEFLMPAHRLAPLLPRRIDFSRLLDLRHMWAVSIEALLYRSRELGSISDATHRRARIKLQALKDEKLIPAARITDFPGETPQLLQRAAQAADLATADLARRLEWPEAKVHLMLGQPPDTRPALRLVQEN